MKRNSLSFYLRIYFRILAQDIKSKMSYRADFIISTVGMIFTNIAGFISFWILFRNFPSINGWGYYEMLFLYGFSLVSLTPVQCFFDNNWSLRMAVYSGDFIKYCFRPINIFFYYQSEVFDIKGLGQLAFGIGTLIYSWTKIGLGFTPLILLKMIVFCGHLLLDNQFILCAGSGDPLQGLCKIPYNHIQSRVQVHIHIPHAHRLHSVLPEPCDTETRRGAAALMALAAYRCFLLLAQLQDMDARSP